MVLGGVAGGGGGVIGTVQRGQEDPGRTVRGVKVRDDAKKKSLQLVLCTTVRKIRKIPYIQ